MPGCSAGEDEDAAYAEKIGGREGEVFEFCSSKIGDKTVVEGLLDRLGLFEDLFEHEMGIAVFREGFGGNDQAFGAFLHGSAALIEYADRIGRDDGDLIVAQEHHIEIFF